MFSSDERQPKEQAMATQQFRMLNDAFLARFRSFMATENNPAGAFDAMPKTQPKENQMSAGYRYVPLKGTGNSLFLRERSNTMAYDAAGEDPNEIPNAATTRVRATPASPWCSAAASSVSTRCHTDGGESSSYADKRSRPNERHDRRRLVVAH
jgi:hypothetical protein